MGRLLSLASFCHDGDARPGFKVRKIWYEMSCSRRRANGKRREAERRGQVTMSDAFIHSCGEGDKT